LKSEIRITDHLGKSLHALQWKPDDSPPKAVVQIVHGVSEHIERYNHFANFLTKNGFAVVGHDHRGHGKTDPDHLGFIAEKEGFELMVKNIRDVNDFVEGTFTGIPRIFFAHSMGSFLVQRYFQVYDDNPAAIIYSGSNGKPPLLLNFGIFLSALLMKVNGPQAKSPLINKLSFGEYNKKFKPNRTDYDWLSRDTNTVDLYKDDPYCGFICSLSFYHQLFTGLKKLHSHRPFAGNDESVPILLLAGSQDPVSNMSRGIKNLHRILIRSGIQTVDRQIYEGGRHDILNEINREEVYSNLLRWINQQIKMKSSTV